ncbi:MAG: hypothetical protein IKG59_03985, partial [Firmicutes bacterium]|nr:hypothetical protein [Bacillota bacterium]
RLLLLAGLLCGAVLGGREGYSQYKAYQKGLEAEAAEAAEAASAPATASQKEQELNMISDRLEEKNRYYTESILGRIDPANEGYASADVIVSARPSEVAKMEASAPVANAEGAAAPGGQTTEGTQDTETNAEAETAENAAPESEESAADGSSESESDAAYIRSKEFNILSFYSNSALYNSDLTEAADALGTQARLLRELITVADGNKSDSMITIKVIYPTQEGAKVILDSVLEQVAGLHDEAQKTYGPHTFLIADRVSSTVVDTSMYKWSNNRAAEITALINSRKTLDKNLASGTTTAKKVVKVSKRDALKAAVTRGATGLAAGIAGAMILTMLYLILAGIVLSGRELNRQYSLRRIACIPGRKYGSLKGPDKWVASIDAAYYNHPNRATCVQVANANLESILGTKIRETQVAMVGDLADEYLEKTAAEFTKTAKASGSRLRYYAIPFDTQTPEGIEAIRNCDAAVLVAKAGRSTYKGVGDVLDMAELLGKNVAGSIVL